VGPHHEWMGNMGETAERSLTNLVSKPKTRVVQTRLMTNRICTIICGSVRINTSLGSLTPEVVSCNPEAALTHCVSTLHDIGDNLTIMQSSSSSSSASRKRQKVYRAVLAEPLLVATLVDKVETKFETDVLRGSKFSH
jgi:hypothetical protein